jgi:hypothetical protein
MRFPSIFPTLRLRRSTQNLSDSTAQIQAQIDNLRIIMAPYLPDHPELQTMLNEAQYHCDQAKRMNDAARGKIPLTRNFKNKF